MAQTIELAQVCTGADPLLTLIIVADGQKGPSEDFGEELPRSLAIREALRGQCTLTS